MTIATIDAKIRAEHLERRAFVYIRQSSPQQLRDHVEGRRRQFQMTDWAEHAGWPKERIVVIDEEGKTAAIPKARMAFGDLITAVGRGDAGIVISLEVSRLARNSPDWHHLIYLSRWTDTLITDGETVYDPKLPADRMVLGIRGQVAIVPSGLTGRCNTAVRNRATRLEERIAKRSEASASTRPSSRCF